MSHIPTVAPRPATKTATVHSYSLIGLDCLPVEIEVDVSPGLPSFIIVGLPDTAVSEARDRVRSAIKNSGYTFPAMRVTVNLAPAHIPKAGSLYDLPIAIGILLAARAVQAKQPLPQMIGELALSGAVRPVRGALPIAATATRDKQWLVVPRGNSSELALLESDTLLGATSLARVVAHLTGQEPLSPIAPGHHTTTEPTPLVDFSDIVGQTLAKHAATVAAAGQHNLLLLGPPGVGKSLLAKAMAGILPPPTKTERLESTMIYSVAGQARRSIQVDSRPYRAPHHTASPASILGGSSQLLPGEISLAHTGVLFFDELPEYRRDVIEALRQPLEEGTITITRASGSATYPAQCLFVAAANPCPCGFLGYDLPDRRRQCTCAFVDIQRYKRKLSGPLLDRIDMKIRLPFIHPNELVQPSHSIEPSTNIRQRTTAARLRQLERQGVPNGLLTPKQLRQYAQAEPAAERLLHQAMNELGLSMRGYAKALRVARTVADLAESTTVTEAHAAEALQLAGALSVDQGAT